MRFDINIFAAISTRRGVMFAGVRLVLRAATKAWLSVLVFFVLYASFLCDGCVSIALDEDFLRQARV